MRGMARPLRILIPDGWYHVMSRGNRRASLFWEESDRRRFLGLVSELPERFDLEVHAFVLMDNHYHLVVRTPQANLSHAIRHPVRRRHRHPDPHDHLYQTASSNPNYRRVQTITDSPVARSRSVTWLGAYVRTLTDERGFTRTFTRDKVGRLTQIDYPHRGADP
jgi:REP element-mobilizing transposase RayT